MGAVDVEAAEARARTRSGDRYLLISTDTHAGPSLERQLRPYCPRAYLEAFDDFATTFRADQSQPALGRDDKLVGGNAHIRLTQAARNNPNAPEWLKAAWKRSKECPGLQDADARRKDMDADGVAAEVVFAGGDNGETLPFTGLGIDAGSTAVAGELKAVGGRIWNDWLADFIADAPERHIGVMQVPIWDIDAAVKEVERGRAAGLKAVNFPAPRADYPPYNDPAYEPFWSACVANNVTLVTHSGGGEPALGMSAPRGRAVSAAEVHWLSRRGLWQLMFGGVFERHPSLKLVFTEQRVTWVPETLRDLDSIFHSQLHTEVHEAMTKPPSEYWVEHCFLSGSFLAPFEAAARNEVGLTNLLWATDYPHQEGTWPRTALTLRNTFADVPETHTRMILGENALAVYDLDEPKLRAIAARIGPAPADLLTKPTRDELPEHTGAAFRTIGTYS